MDTQLCENLIAQAIDLVGLKSLSEACGVSHQAVRKWANNNRLPRTEWTGETKYAEVIERVTDGQVTKSQLLRTPTAA